MHEAIAQMLKKYAFASQGDYENALKEIIQEIALLGLWRSKFFEHAAFYGGTALRVLYGLDRFSEDLDFSLLKKNTRFDLKKYNIAIKAELESYGFKVSVESKTKSIQTEIESAFIKAGTLHHLLEIQAPKNMIGAMSPSRTLKIKLEVDKDPPPGFLTEAKFLLLPTAFSVNTFQLPDLFAGKLHALLCRQWQIRIKGRDWYDLVWYMGRSVPVRLKHLEQRMRQSGHWQQTKALSKVSLLQLLKDKIGTTDFDLAKQDVTAFIRDQASLSLWSKVFFEDVVSRVEIV